MFCSRNLIQNYILNSAAFIGSVHTSYNLIIYTSIELNRIGLAEIRPQRGSYISKIDYAIVEESGFVRFVMETAVVKRVCESITCLLYTSSAITFTDHADRLYIDQTNADAKQKTGSENHRIDIRKYRNNPAYRQEELSLIHISSAFLLLPADSYKSSVSDSTD